MIKAKRKLVSISSIFTVIAIICASLVYYGEFDLRVTEYTIENEKITTPFKVAMLSDLHLREYGKGSEKLLAAIKEKSPDIILVAGDMVNKNNENTDVAINLFSELCKITDVYFCLGNHERALDKKTGNVFSQMQKTGAVFLDNEDVTVQVNGQDIMIGGLSSYPDPYTEHYDFITQFEKKALFKILLCHYPEYYPDTLENYKLDLILSGHAHGGQVRLPFIGGVFAPEQGLFPKYTKGIYKSDTATMIISAGLGDSTFIPRINNPPELVIVEVK
ncbi:MAG: metallophosphoesterase [Clostridia bacterium]|nr:metallophosphoesterase [Clostridia bacterium]